MPPAGGPRTLHRGLKRSAPAPGSAPLAQRKALIQEYDDSCPALPHRAARLWLSAKR